MAKHKKSLNFKDYIGEMVKNKKTRAMKEETEENQYSTFPCTLLSPSASSAPHHDHHHLLGNKHLMTPHINLHKRKVLDGIFALFLLCTLVL